MIEAAFILFWLTVFGCIGRGILLILRVRQSSALMISPVIGAAFSIPFSVVSYVLGLPTEVIFRVISGIGFISAVGFLWASRSSWMRFRLFRRHVRFIPVILWLAAVGCLLAPKLVGGPQFSVFQANRWDTFSYLEAAMGYHRNSFDFLKVAGAEQHLADPLTVQAKLQLFNRPAVHMFYAVCAHFHPSRMWDLHYPFLVIFASLTALAVAYFLRVVFRVGSVNGMLIGTAFVLGFWGQYILDINSWSQLSATPMFAAFAGGMISRFRAKQVSARFALVNALFIAAGLYIYPEAFLVVAFTIGVSITVVMFVLDRSWRPGYAELLLSTLFAVVATIPFFKGTLAVAYSQYFLAGTENVTWWKQYQAFFAGRDAIQYLGAHIFDQPGQIVSKLGIATALSKVVDIGAGYLGLYFLTPGPDSPSVWKFFIRILLLTFCAALVTAAAVTLFRRAKMNHTLKANTATTLICLLLAHLVIFILVVKHSYWQAGKAISYFSPLGVALLLVPISRSAKKGFSIWMLPAVLYIVFCWGEAGMRIYASGRNSGIHYPFPYPGLEDSPTLKTGHDWNMARFDQSVAGCTMTRIEIKNGFVEHHAMLYLASHRKAFFTESPIDGLYGQSEVKIGRMKRTQPDDCVMTEAGIEKAPGKNP